jgi:hypothetical protein
LNRHIEPGIVFLHVCGAIFRPEFIHHGLDRFGVGNRRRESLRTEFSTVTFGTTAGAAEKSERQIPRGRKAAQDDKNKGLVTAQRKLRPFKAWAD